MGYSPLVLSLWVAGWASLFALIGGTLLAWVLVKSSLRGKWVLEGFIMLPLFLPPTVVGYYLLTLLGQRGVGPWLEQLFGIRLVFALPGAVIAATIAALPLVVQTVQAGLASVPRQIEDAGRIDGCTQGQLLRFVYLPLVWRALVAGLVLGFLRALGDFGITLMVAGNIPGRTQTMSMAIYDAVQANDLAQANQLALILLFIGFSLIFVVMRLKQRVDW
jgi:molybdate transport system permease protein